MQEIERKFLVTSNEFKNQSISVHSIAQGYLSLDPARTVRVRVQENQGFLTIKGKSNTSGTSRFEWEKAIDVEEANSLLSLTEGTLIEKKRYRVPVGIHCFEVDVFKGKNDGLVIAEVELRDENELFEKPLWLGKEVTGNPEYYNSFLARAR